MELENKRIGFAITGSFCTLSKIIPEVENLYNRNCDLTMILSEKVASLDTRFFLSREFVEKIESITHKKALKSIVEVEPIGPKNLLDLLVIAPCTGNTLAKISQGVTDSTVTMAAKAHLRNGKPLVVAIATNDGLANSAKNIGQLLNYKNIYFVPFGQDDYKNKKNSLVASFNLIQETIENALEGTQIQPILLK